MKKSRIYLLLAIFTVAGFVLGLGFDSIVGKAYAKTESLSNKFTLPEGAAFESEATGTGRSADYEIVSIYGRHISSSAQAAISRCWSIEK